MKIHRKHLLLSLLIVVLLAVAGFAWYFSRPYHKKTATIPSSTSVGAPTNNQPVNQNNGNRGSSSSSNSASSSSNVGPHVTLIAPWGDFVSNHHPGQGGAPTSETSTCNTTPGATCFIRFTNGTKTRDLDSKVANGNGAVIWNWDVNSAGFSSGSWQVTAIATLNGQTKSANDSLPLVVQ